MSTFTPSIPPVKERNILSLKNVKSRWRFGWTFLFQDGLCNNWIIFSNFNMVCKWRGNRWSNGSNDRRNDQLFWSQCARLTRSSKNCCELRTPVNSPLHLRPSPLLYFDISEMVQVPMTIVGLIFSILLYLLEKRGLSGQSKRGVSSSVAPWRTYCRK